MQAEHLTGTVKLYNLCTAQCLQVTMKGGQPELRDRVQMFQFWHKQLKRLINVIPASSLSLSHSLSENLPHPSCQRGMSMSSMSLNFCLVNTLAVSTVYRRLRNSRLHLSHSPSRGAKLTLLPF